MNNENALRNAANPMHLIDLVLVYIYIYIYMHTDVDQEEEEEATDTADAAANDDSPIVYSYSRY